MDHSGSERFGRRPQAREETRLSKESKQSTKALKLEAASLRCTVAAAAAALSRVLCAPVFLKCPVTFAAPSGATAGALASRVPRRQRRLPTKALQPEAATLWCMRTAYYLPGHNVLRTPAHSARTMQRCHVVTSERNVRVRVQLEGHAA